MKIAVIGATGLVGKVMTEVLGKSKLSIDTFIPVASAKSVGNEVNFRNRIYTVIGMEEALHLKPDFALFSAGGDASREWAPKFAAIGTRVIDNSSAWRMDHSVPLVVPEINQDSIRSEHMIIANPNCSTIQMVMALAPLHKKYGIKRIVVSTYQSVTGTGAKAVGQMEDERNNRFDGDRVYAHVIDKNVIPHCDSFLDNGYTKEEMKIVDETRKILDDLSIQITATAVRVPVMGGHSEAVNVEFLEEFELDEVRALLSRTPGVVVQDNPARNLYPMPRLAQGQDDVFVGRLRRDDSQPRTLNMWIVSDNLRKGAATNAVQIMQGLIGEAVAQA